MIIDQEKIFLDAFERNKKRIYRICCSYSNSNEDAQDLLQEVALNIWKSLCSFKNKSSIDTWVFRICINVCMRTSGTNNKQKQLFKSLGEGEIENLPIEAESSQETKESLAALLKAINKLNKADKSLIVLYLEDIPYKEISEILGITENHIAVKIKRIKAKLHNHLKNIGNG